MPTCYSHIPTDHDEIIYNKILVRDFFKNFLRRQNTFNETIFTKLTNLMDSKL